MASRCGNCGRLARILVVLCDDAGEYALCRSCIGNDAAIKIVSPTLGKLTATAHTKPPR